MGGKKRKSRFNRSLQPTLDQPILALIKQQPYQLGGQSGARGLSVGAACLAAHRPPGTARGAWRLWTCRSTRGLASQQRSELWHSVAFPLMHVSPGCTDANKTACWKHTLPSWLLEDFFFPFSQISRPRNRHFSALTVPCSTPFTR